MSTLLTLLASVCLASAAPDVAPRPDPMPGARRQGEVLVQYRDKPPAWAAGSVLPRRGHVAVLTFDEAEQSFEDVQARLRQNPQILRVEPNLLFWTQRDWAHRDLRIAQGGFGAVLRQAQPWAAPPTRALRIGILDTGVDRTHPDLAGSIGVGVNLVSTASRGEEGTDGSDMDYNGHGTQVAGIIGARHNGFGIDGINDQAELNPIKVFDQDGVGCLADVLEGIAWARDRHVDILNMSFGTYEPSSLLAAALRDAAAAGMVLVAAAGNDGAGEVTYPAALPEVLAVGSVDTAGISRFSNFGPNVDCYAPGDGILSTTSQHLGPHGYAPLSGTSAAAAHLSGVLAWVLQGGVAPAQAREYIASRSPWRQDSRDPGTPPYRAVATERIISDLLGRSLTALTVTRWRLPSHVAGDVLRVEVALQNVGNRPWPADILRLDLRGEGGHEALRLGRTPVLPVGASFRQTYDVPLPGHLRAGRRTAWRGSLRLGATALDGGPQDVVLTDAPEPHLSVRNMWLTPFNRALTPTPMVHVRLHNDGNVPLPAHQLAVSVIAAVHEGIWSVPALPLTDRVAVAALAPGAWLDVALPAIEPLPAAADFTLLAELWTSENPAPTARAIQPFSLAPAGQAKVLYNQVAHMASVEAAVALLQLQNIIISDIHSDNAPFKGSVATARDFGSAINIGASTWRWDWQVDWPRYPWSAKHLIDGASACDGIDVAFGDSGINTWDTHYWIVDQGDNVGLGNHSALAKIRALLLGDPSSTIKDGAIAAYRAGDAARAWWMVGHAAHLLGDLSTGAHTINRNWHGLLGDPYHDWVGQEGHFRSWPATEALAAGGVLDTYRGDLLTVSERLRFLAYTTAQVGASFPWHRTRPWLPSRGASYGDGDRTLGGDWPHYDAYLRPFFAGFVEHPHSIRDLNSDEVLNAAHRCVAVPRASSSDKLRDCWDGGDGHIDRNNILTGDLDGDLSRVADVAYTHAVRAIAGLIYLFARETGQL